MGKQLNVKGLNMKISQALIRKTAKKMFEAIKKPQKEWCDKNGSARPYCGSFAKMNKCTKNGWLLVAEYHLKEIHKQKG